MGLCLYMILSVFMQTDHCDISIINLIKLEAIQRLFYAEVCVPKLFLRQDKMRLELFGLDLCNIFQYPTGKFPFSTEFRKKSWIFMCNLNLGIPVSFSGLRRDREKPFPKAGTESGPGFYTEVINWSTTTSRKAQSGRLRPRKRQDGWRSTSGWLFHHALGCYFSRILPEKSA